MKLFKQTRVVLQRKIFREKVMLFRSRISPLVLNEVITIQYIGSTTNRKKKTKTKTRMVVPIAFFVFLLIKNHLPYHIS